MLSPAAPLPACKHGEGSVDIEEAKHKFIIDDDELKTRLEALVSRALEYCRIDSKGRVHFENRKLSNKDKLKLALVARAIASELDPRFSGDVTIPELVESTGMPIAQVRARCSELVAEQYAESPSRGVFRVIFGKISQSLDSVSG